jgi:uncharacterized membrane protein (DUF485 family)
MAARTRILAALFLFSAEPTMESQNSRIGLVLFVAYLLLYGGFVLLNAFSPATMEQTPWEGVNLAILSGFGLIGAAFLFALIYGWASKGDKR